MALRAQKKKEHVMKLKNAIGFATRAPIEPLEARRLLADFAVLVDTQLVVSGDARGAAFLIGESPPLPTESSRIQFLRAQ